MGIRHLDSGVWLLTLCCLLGCTKLKENESREQDGIGMGGTVAEGGTAMDGGGGAGGGGGADGSKASDAGLPFGADGGSDAACTPGTFYRDQDGDGAGNADDAMQACSAADGYTAQAGDCDDACDSCFVGAAEQCDGRDNDCDENIDEAIATSCGSETGVCELGTQHCENGALGACTGGTAATDEVCEGTLDEDCDGSVDESCPCTTGETRLCGIDTGECAPGEQICVAGALGACEGATQAVSEVCDGRDNDCDGQSDETITMACGRDVGECVAGVSTCVDGEMGPCMNETVASGEICDGRDNDCDNLTDENLTRACATARAGVGICQAGTETCNSGSWGSCVGAVTAGTETCDAARLDEDCDGTGNENCACTHGATGNCGNDTGACSFGTWTCNAGTWGPTCSGGQGPSPEICNDIDDDCDTNVDEGLTRSCGQSQNPPCRLGTETCSSGRWANCTAVNPGPAEICDVLSVDEDCDGLNNEGCDCVNGSSRSCTVGSAYGVCRAGRQSCVGGRWAQPCVSIQQASPEECNGLDDDCDGTVDDNCPCSQNSDCPTGEGCGSDGLCYQAYGYCGSNAACPPGFNCTLGIGMTHNSCKPPCVPNPNNIADPTRCPLPSGASSNILPYCYPFNDASGTHNRCLLACSNPASGGCPYGMSCVSITGACTY